MPRYVPLTERERLMLRNFVNDCATYDDKVLAVGLIDAYDDLPEHDPLAGMQEMRKKIETHLRDLAAVAQEHAVEPLGHCAGIPVSRQTFSDPGDGYDSAIRWNADLERGAL